jgi:UbiA prenyltransferase family
MTSLLDIAELIRAPAALSVPGDGIAGAALAGTLGPETAGLCAAGACLYLGGMAANDWADRDLDATERPGRPIPSGRVTAGTALGTAVGLSAAGLALAWLSGGRRALAVAAALSGTAWCYDLKLKDTVAGPAAMATCRGLDVLLGASTRSAASKLSGAWRRAMGPALTVAAHTYTLTALSRREVTGGGSRLLPSATLAGTAGVAVAAATATPVVPAAALGKGGPGGRLPPVRRGRWSGLVPPGLAGWYAASYGATQVRALAAPEAANVRAAVRAGITCLPALQGAFVARSAGPRAGAIVAACAPLGHILAKRLSPT